MSYLDLNFHCVYLGKGTISATKYYEKTKRTVKRSENNEAWHLGLGMHNFRAIERKYSKKQVKNGGNKSVKKSSKSCVELVAGYRNMGFNPVFSVSRKPFNVNKAVEASRDVNEDSYEFTCRSLRQICTRQDSRYQRFLIRQSKSRKRLLLEKEMVRRAKIEANMRRTRYVRRRNFIQEKSFNKLPTMFLKNCGKNGFSRYCTLVMKVGHGYAFWLVNNWKTSEAYKIRVGIEKEERRLKEIDDLKHKSGWHAEGGYDPTKGSRPSRGNFANFKSWRDALELWQKPVAVCKPCYKSKYNREYDADKCMWKKDAKYSFQYLKSVKGEFLHCEACRICIRDVPT